MSDEHDLNLPYFHQLNGMQQSVQMVGQVKKEAKRFQVDLLDRDGEYVLHFNVRFDEDCIVRNCTQSGQQWQTEQRAGGLPFHPGNPFTLELVAGENSVKALVNGLEHSAFETTKLDQVVELKVDGDIRLLAVKVAGESGQQQPSDDQGEVVHLEPEPVEPDPQPEPVEPQPVEPHPEQPQPVDPVAPHPVEPQEPAQPVQPVQPVHPAEPHPHQPAQPVHPSQPVDSLTGQLTVPYHGPLQEFAHTRRLRIVGVPTANAQQFQVAMRLNNGEVLFHFNPRLDQNCVVRNATKNMQWQPEWEERTGGECPFHVGKQFALDFIANGNVIMCFVDGANYCQYTIHEDLNQLNSLQILGDLQLNQVLIA